MPASVSAARISAPTLCTTLPVRRRMFEPDGHGEPGADLQRDLGQAAAGPVDVAVVHEVADFEEDDQHGEQDRARLDHARRLVVGAPAQQLAADPERRRRHAVAVEQPVEDRRGADVAADDARLPADARHHQRADDGGEPAQRRQRPLLRTQAMPGTISASATVSQPFSSAKVSASASAATVPVAKIAPAPAMPGRGARLPSVSVAQPNSAASSSASAGERDRALEAGDAIVERDQDGERRRTPPSRSTASAMIGAASGPARGSRRRRTAPRSRCRARDASRCRQRSGSGARRRRGPDGAIRCCDLRRQRPAQHHERGQHRRDRHGAGSRVGAPGDRDGRDRQHGEDGERGRIVPARQHQQQRGEQIGRQRDATRPVDLAGLGRRAVEQAGDDQRGDQRKAGDDVEQMRAERRRRGSPACPAASKAREARSR